MRECGRKENKTFFALAPRGRARRLVMIEQGVLSGAVLTNTGIDVWGGGEPLCKTQRELC